MNFQKQKKFALFLLTLFLILHTYTKVKNFSLHATNKVSSFSFESNSSQNKAWSEKFLMSHAQLEKQYENNDIVILAFWETWCEPCIEEMPILEDIYKNHARVQIIGVFYSSTISKVQEFLNETPISFPLLKDKKKLLHKKYNIEGYPTIVVLDTNRKVLLQKSGWSTYPDGRNSLDPVKDIIREVKKDIQ